MNVKLMAALESKGKVALIDTADISQHVFRSRRRQTARATKETNLLRVQLELAGVKFRNALLQGKLKDALAEICWWRDWWAAYQKEEIVNSDPIVETKTDNDMASEGKGIGEHYDLSNING